MGRMNSREKGGGSNVEEQERPLPASSYVCPLQESPPAHKIKPCGRSDMGQREAWQQVLSDHEVESSR